MFGSKSETAPQFVDRFLQRTAIGVLMMSLAYLIGAALYLVQDPWQKPLDVGQFLLSIGAVVVVLPVFLGYVRLRASGECSRAETDGFVADVFNRACVMAFSLTFVILIALEPLTRRFFEHLPTPFFINLILGLSLGVFSVTFFRLSHDDEDDDDFDVGDPEPDA